ncbi:hypothetical protein pdul_cds_677 [Pandoravirus dulcis]|uniref:Uncharacterized protein n=1 Tax=Pandoravirus dulcis TaxID=1349409 RepID=S4VR35_9VIRU|nr:hypothetical protein pdul_cds_677 [Pandoravirus dulcis]AGO82828.2 hypothetical protein pdul_cds_677 [Pandoravirus dulcis]
MDPCRRLPVEMWAVVGHLPRIRGVAALGIATPGVRPRPLVDEICARRTVRASAIVRWCLLVHWRGKIRFTASRRRLSGSTSSGPFPSNHDGAQIRCRPTASHPPTKKHRPRFVPLFVPFPKKVRDRRKHAREKKIFHSGSPRGHGSAKTALAALPQTKKTQAAGPRWTIREMSFFLFV